MPRSKLTLAQTIQNARNRIDRIITKYNCRDLLLNQSNEFKRTKNPALKQAFNDYKTLHKNESIVQRYDKALDDSSSISSSNQLSQQQQRRPQDPPPFAVANTTSLSSTSSSSHYPSSFTGHNNQCTSTITETISTATIAPTLPPPNTTVTTIDNHINTLLLFI